MLCDRCGKQMSREDGMDKFELSGVDVSIHLSDDVKTPENIEYYNKQMGRYSNGEGCCHLSLCIECWFDSLMGV